MSYIDSEKNFFGRNDILDLLKRRVVDLKEGYRQNVALLGNQYVGKSSLLHHFLVNMDDEGITVIYLDLENKDFNYFFTKFTGSLLYNFSKNKKLPLHDDLNLLLESTKDVIPHTVQVIKKIRTDFSKNKHADCFLGLMTLPEIFTNETGQYCVLILDEFQNLEELFVPNVFRDLGKKIMTQKRCFYIVSSSYQDLAKKILSEKLSLLFGNFEVIHVEPFDFQASQEFVEHALVDSKIGIQLRSFLGDFTGGHPLYLSLLCQELINLSAIHGQGEIYMPLLSQAVENTIFDRWGVISRHFELTIKGLCNGKDSHVISSILMSIANGKHKFDEIVADSGMKKSQLKQKINHLLEMGIIVKNGNFHCFKDRLFRYWVKFVFQKRLKVVELAPDKQRKQFKEELNTCVENFKISSRKDFSSRIIELLDCFDNEAFDLNGRKYKLPEFRKMTPVKYKNDSGVSFDIIKASTENATWFIVMKKEIFGENDVNAVLAEAKKIMKKPERCLIISLSDLDENARLRALQERFWIWNERELNALLTLFDKPYIVR